MREIKFRAWDTTDKQMIDFNTEGIDIYTLLFYKDGWEITFDNSEDDLKYLGQKGFILLQYTGLKDKNGKEIYEGDIIKTHFTKTPQYNAYDEIGEVLFQGNLFNGVTIANREHGNNFQIYSHSEVIGNIYENPELVNK